MISPRLLNAMGGSVSVESFDVQFVSSNRDEEGRPFRWRHGAYTWEEAVKHSLLMTDYFNSDDYQKHHRETGIPGEAPRVSVSIVKCRSGRRSQE